MFDYEFIPAANISGGIMLAWHKDYWAASRVVKGAYSLLARLTPAGQYVPWWLTVVYGPQHDDEKVEFLDELLRCSETCLGP
jgi:hypothetical protein